MNESIIYGLIIGAFSLIDLFQHNSYHVALKDRPAILRSHPQSFASSFPYRSIESVASLRAGIWSVLYRSEYVVVYMVIGLLEHDLI